MDKLMDFFTGKLDGELTVIDRELDRLSTEFQTHQISKEEAQNKLKDIRSRYNVQRIK